MRFTKFVLSVFCTAALLAIPSFSQTPSTTPAPAAKPKSTTTTTTTTAKPAATASTYDRTLLKPALLKDKAPDTYQVKFETSRGDFAVTVTRAWAPIAADRFYNLIKHHFYDGARFFRVVPDFVVQFGISAYPPVTAAWQNATIQDESSTQHNKRGTLTFAKTSKPNSRTVEIFINLKDNTSSLDRQGFAPFGAVDGSGMNIVSMFYDQYGDSAGMDQDPMERGGEKYIATKWPKLDVIKHATLVGGTVSTSSPKPATAPKSSTTTAPAAKPQP